MCTSAVTLLLISQLVDVPAGLGIVSVLHVAAQLRKIMALTGPGPPLRGLELLMRMLSFCLGWVALGERSRMKVKGYKRLKRNRERHVRLGERGEGTGGGGR